MMCEVHIGEGIISRYSDISLVRSGNVSEFAETLVDNNTDIKYDWFHYHASTYNDVYLYAIDTKDMYVGYVAIYNIDMVNRNADIYGYVSEKRHYGELLRSLISMMYHSFDVLHLNKVSFKHREDNYFYDDAMRHLSFVKEGILRGQLTHEEKEHNVVAYGMLAYEFRRLAVSDYRRMYTWDYDYTPIAFNQVDITSMMNSRVVTNSIDNPNRVVMNDLGEFVLTIDIPDDECLRYKDTRFDVNIFDTSLLYDNMKCEGQEVEIPEGNYSELLIVTMAQFGYQKSHLKLTYSDGTQEEAEFNVSDWCERVLRDEHIIYYASGCRRLSYDVNVVKCDSFVYLKRVSVDLSKQLRKVIFPIKQTINIFAIGLCRNG